MNQIPIHVTEVFAAIVFAVALIHTFLTKQRQAGRHRVFGLTPNPAGMAILRGHFDDETVHPLGLLLSALPPTLIAALAFRCL